MRIGILGGGQLSRMLALAGYPLGFEFTFLEPTADACARELGRFICAPYQDQNALRQFADQVDIITFENENIPVDTLTFLNEYKPVRPGIKALTTSQDRLFEKTLFRSLDIPCAPFAQINSYEDLLTAAKTLSFPLFLKTRREGYDGKGQLKINNLSELEAINPTMLSNAIVEQGIAFQREVSLIAARSVSHEIVFYDICENRHQNGILIETQNKVDDPLFETAKTYLTRLLDALDYIGILCVEFFQVDNQLIANEMAPRVHNSGHWTIEGATTSQFENHLRAIANLPLGNTQSLGQATMRNLIGTMPNKNELLAQGHLHDYHKAPKPGRKLGHVTKVVF